jgi:formylglycine-generating enzyme required for sulfatase activity
MRTQFSADYIISTCGFDLRQGQARGGSWRNDTNFLRAAVRVKRNINVRFDTIGFRVARKLNP